MASLPNRNRQINADAIPLRKLFGPWSHAAARGTGWRRAAAVVVDRGSRKGRQRKAHRNTSSWVRPSRAVAEYLSVLDDAAFGGATPTEPKAISPTDPAARYTAAANSAAVYAYSDNYLVDLKQQFASQENHLAMVDDVLETLVHQQHQRFMPGSDRDPGF